MHPGSYEVEFDISKYKKSVAFPVSKKFLGHCKNQTFCYFTS